MRNHKRRDERVKRHLKRLSVLEEPKSEKTGWLPGACKLGLCGEEAACLPGPNSTHKCICPSDLSAPVTDRMLCPNRKTVPLTPKPILNINVGGGTTYKNRSSVIRDVENMGLDKSQLTFSEFLFGFLGLLLLCFGILGITYWFKKRSLLQLPGKTYRRKPHLRVKPKIGGPKLYSGNFVVNPQYVPDDSMPAPILSKDDLIFSQEIGRGFFGKVFKGELKKEDGSTETVAIKVLKDSVSKQAEEDFMREVETMSSFRHENILTLIGIVQEDSTSRPWMVFEFMVHGDLAEVLRSNSRPFWKPVPGLKPLNEESLLSIALQIAGGMKYLSSQRFVHNDLACRNCLVGSGLTVKIADFGMSRDVYTSDYYRMGGTKPVPLRWMPPESVMYRKFTLESDVWSYGVVLWEIYSFGKQPYYGLNNEEVLKLILQGTLLVPPDNCPEYIRELMIACWKIKPRERIKFKDIYNTLKTQETNLDQPIICENVANVPFIDEHAGKNEETRDSLPMPPNFPVPPVPGSETLDLDDYLIPRTDRINQYLEPQIDLITK